MQNGAFQHRKDCFFDVEKNTKEEKTRAKYTQQSFEK